MKVYILSYCETVESGSGYAEMTTITGVFSSPEEARQEADEKNKGMTKLQQEYCWYEVTEHEVK